MAVDHVRYSVSLDYWEKEFSVALQAFNVSIITHCLSCFIGKMVEVISSVRDFSTARAFERQCCLRNCGNYLLLLF